MTYKLGSLFDGSGGFPLAGSLCGIEPVWAAEVEPYPVAVTRSRFPKMKHYGDVSKINGAEVEPVDILSFGAPCQDLSVAGLRKGLRHEANGDEETTRSGLFMEAVRIIKEMREATNGRYPAFAIYENVPGAFSSSGGEDWRTVLQSLIEIVEPGAAMPDVPAGGWAYADWFMGEGWSLAYRVLDAQYWGVPQRRRRIYLVLDLRGERAGKILFERDGLRGYFAQSGAAGQETAGDAEVGAGADDREGLCDVKVYESHPMDSRIKELVDDISPTVSVKWHKGAADTPLVCERYLGIIDALPFDTTQVTSPQNGNNPKWGDPCHPLAAQGHPPTVICKAQHLFENHSQDTRYKGPLDVCPMLPAQLGTGGNNTPFVVEGQPVAFSFDSLASNSMKSSNPHSGCRQVEVAKTLDTTDPNPSKNQGGIAVVEQRPVYCLQGNGIDRADTAGCNGKGWTEDVSYTLNTIDRPAVAYSIGNGQLNQISMSETCNTLDCMHDKQAVLVEDKKAYGWPLGFRPENVRVYEETATTICNGTRPGFTNGVIQWAPVRYIVRRLTPTECARLQGFPDKWGHPDHKDSLTDEEYSFWMDVRNTHATINGKAVKEYTREQMLKWYNGLHTDSAEYKMWGNGIALPCALYVLQGIEDALKEETAWT